MSQTVAKPGPGRASVPASPDFRRFPGMLGLAGTLALPNWVFSHNLIKPRHFFCSQDSLALPSVYPRKFLRAEDI